MITQLVEDKSKREVTVETLSNTAVLASRDGNDVLHHVFITRANAREVVKVLTAWLEGGG